MPTSQNNSTDKWQLLSSDQPKSLWRNRDYLLLWSGQALSDIGGAVSELAFSLLVLAVTHSPAQAGFVAALRLPYHLAGMGLAAGNYGYRDGDPTGAPRTFSLIY